MSAYPLGLTTVVGGPGIGTTFIARLQHAGLRESNCIVATGSLSYRVSCQTAEATVLHADFDDDPKKGEFRVVEKLVASIDAAMLPALAASAARSAAASASAQKVVPPFFPERPVQR